MKNFLITAFAVFVVLTNVRGGVHYVKPYTNSHGTYVKGHLSGNPGSGVHCHNNNCS